MKIMVIAAANLRRLLRDRSSIFFVFVFPLALVLLIGLQFYGGGGPQIGLFAPESGSYADRVVQRLSGEEGVEIEMLENEEALVSAVETGAIEAAIVIPPGFDQAIADGLPSQVGFIARPAGVGPSLRAVVAEAVQAAVLPATAARFVADQGLADFAAALSTAELMQPRLLPISVITNSVGESMFPPTLGRFDLGASSQLLLFMFLTALSGGAVLIQTRQLGLSRRMLASPTSVSTILTGEALGRFAVVIVQGAYIMIGTLLLFGVNWGDPLGAVAVLIMFAAVGAGAAMLIGTVFRNAEQAGGVAVVAGLGLAALGGCMLPLQLFSPTLRTVAHITPHAWAMDAFTTLVLESGRLRDILPELGILAGYAVVLLLVASWRLRAVITR
ncbi:MAG TPA: ABC transporter permease [Acidimicrobiia bacterium]|nr:ABC transporter permease [Acidimicrobiia bacterium]